MIYKRFLKKFNSQSDYESQKDSVMGIPHVVLFEDTKELLYASESEIPSVDYSKEYFTIVNTSGSPLTIQLKQNKTVQTLNYKLSTSSDWISNTALTVGVGEEVQFKGNYTPSTSYGIGTFKISGGTFDVKGNIMSLLFDDNFVEQTSLKGYPYAFRMLFTNCTTLTNANELILPATTLAKLCYSYIFDGCTSLTTAPELPATTLAEWCYGYMFKGCTSLTTAPELLATTLASSCYSYMFYGCTSLTTAPELLATTLADYCYSSMFRDCSNLTTVPELPATTLANYCYRYMFNGCTSLTTAPELPATTLANYCYANMFEGCSSLVDAPELPATTLASYCYQNMFNGCSKLNSITMLATDISASNCLKYWVTSVSSSGTFIKHPSMTTLPSGTSGIPNGWTVENCDVITPSITKNVNNDVVFYYSDGMFTPSSSDTQLYPYYSEEQLLSMQPQCDIYVNIFDNNGNELMSDYIWETTKKLEDIMIENNLSNVLNLFINITSIVIPNNNGSYYY